MNTELFKLVRHFLKMNQRQFADYLNVTYSTVADIEAGERAVSDNVRAKIAHKFDATSDEFQAFVNRNRLLSEN